MSSFIQSYKSAINNYVNFRGRTSRRDYWQFIGILYGVMLVIYLIGLPFYISGVTIFIYISVILIVLWLLFTFLPSLAISVRRLHDIGRSGWWVTAALGSALIGGFLDGMVEAAQAEMVSVGPVLSIATVATNIAAVLFFVILIVFAVQRSSPLTNRYGPPPAGISQTEARMVPAALSRTGDGRGAEPGLIVAEFEKLLALKKNGDISEEDFDLIKSRLLRMP